MRKMAHWVTSYFVNQLVLVWRQALEEDGRFLSVNLCAKCNAWLNISKHSY